MADALDSKSSEVYSSYRFDSDLRHCTQYDQPHWICNPVRLTTPCLYRPWNRNKPFAWESSHMAERWVQRAGYQRLAVAGINHANADYSRRQDIIRRLSRTKDKTVHLLREPSNPVDQDAVAVVSSAGTIGYLRKEDATQIAHRIDQEESRFTAQIYLIEPFKTDDGRSLLSVKIDVKEWEFREAKGIGAEPPAPNVGEMPHQISLGLKAFYWFTLPVFRLMKSNLDFILGMAGLGFILILLYVATSKFTQ